jgi:hypothetical protein
MAKVTKWRLNTIPRSKKPDFIWSKTTAFRRKYWANSVQQSNCLEHRQSTVRISVSIYCQTKELRNRLRLVGFKGLKLCTGHYSWIHISTLHYAMYIMPFTLCHVHYAMYIMTCTLWHVHYAMYIMPCTLCHVHYDMYIMPCTLCHAHYVMYIMTCTLCHVHYAMYIMPCTLCHVHSKDKNDKCTEIS